MNLWVSAADLFSEDIWLVGPSNSDKEIILDIHFKIPGDTTDQSFQIDNTYFFTMLDHIVLYIYVKNNELPSHQSKALCRPH